jgi:ATP-dependent Lon protease
VQDLVELPDEVRQDMTFVPATTLDDVLKVALPEVAGGAATGAVSTDAAPAAAKGVSS